MTPPQWLFHYHEVKKQKDKKDEMYLSLFNVLLKVIEKSAIMSHPNIDLKKVVDYLIDKYASDDEKLTPEEAESFVEEMKNIFPETIQASTNAAKSKVAFKKAKVDKKLGIIIPKKEREGG